MIVIRILFISMSWQSFFAVTIFLWQVVLLFNSIGHVIPVRYIFGSMMSLQFLFGPTLAYNGLDKYQYIMYQMKIPETAYFNYAIPAVLCFIVGLHIKAGRLNGERLELDGIKKYMSLHPKIPYYFIVGGFICDIIKGFLPEEIAFLISLLADFKFIGLFILLYAGIQIKVLPLILVMGSIINKSIQESMFHGLLTWIIFLGAILAIKYKPGFKVKLSLFIAFILLAVSIQQVKNDYRANMIRGQEAELSLLLETYEKKNEKKSIFSFESLAPSNSRINQGYILTNVMKTVPDRVPFSNGEELQQLLEAAFLPRVLAPNKLTAGNQDLFKKFTGIGIQKGTSMAIGSLGDAYLNFGLFGGCVFMFLLGFIYCIVLNFFQKKSDNYPLLLIFTPLVFNYPIRPDCELQTILGHLVKSCFLLFVIFYYWKNVFSMEKNYKEQSFDQPAKT